MEIMTDWTPIAVLLGDGAKENAARQAPEENDAMMDGLFLAFAKARVTLHAPEPTTDTAAPTS